MGHPVATENPGSKNLKNSRPKKFVKSNKSISWFFFFQFQNQPIFCPAGHLFAYILYIHIICLFTIPALANNVILKVNNIDQMSNGSKMTRDFATPSQLSNEADSAWEGSDNQDFRNNSTQLFRQNSDLEPDFPPKPVSLCSSRMNALSLAVVNSDGLG